MCFLVNLVNFNHFGCFGHFYEVFMVRNNHNDMHTYIRTYVCVYENEKVHKKISWG